MTRPNASLGMKKHTNHDTRTLEVDKIRWVDNSSHMDQRLDVKVEDHQRSESHLTSVAYTLLETSFAVCDFEQIFLKTSSSTR